ncbi:MAG: prepilin-type N-terminal cleavage/methylation domain-containing protein [Campylobacterota bacterium]|nr:prepilin-type N-terminal cleavage/methylation domain-containing protein [Campylobacterota bacterium]
MKRFVSAWNMPKRRDAFTLIEVMISVMIISVVIMALLQMHGNSNHIFLKISSQLKTDQYASFFIANKEYGFEKDRLSLDDLISDFKVEDELRRELKKVKVELIYEELELIDMSEDDESQDSDSQESSSVIFEVGKTILKMNDTTTSLIRLRIQ